MRRRRKISRAYVQYINEEYDAERLTQILGDVVDIIGANILNIARQDYDPQGASVTMLISEQPVTPTDSQIEESPGPLPDTVVAHLDKSHITVHTYPEIHPDDGIATFRVDIDVSTCGVISPLKALNYLIHQFDSTSSPSTTGYAGSPAMSKAGSTSSTTRSIRSRTTSPTTPARRTR